MDVCAAFYHRVNDDMFETFLRTFRKVSNALLQVYTDNVPVSLQVKWSNDYNVGWIQLTEEQVKRRRCLCRIKCLCDCSEMLTSNDRLIFSDVDVYFLEDPFTAFDKRGFSVGVTTRFHTYKFPINSGLVFVRPSKETDKIFGIDFEGYADENKEYWDWYIDQNYLNYLYENGEAVDVGWEYNFCPNTDVFGVNLAADMIRRAYESRSVKVLHLKSELKMEIYEGYMEDAVTKNCCGSFNWRQDGK